MLKLNHIFIFIYSFFIINISYGQDFNSLKLYPFYNLDYKKDNSKAIKPIRDLFLRYNLVLLAESTHYDGATIDAQCMIMKELIDSGIINTIYTESSWLNAETIMTILLKEGKAGVVKAKKYATSGEMINWVDNDFWEYLTDKIIERKIRLVGFDIETNSTTLTKELFDEAQSNVIKQRLMDSVSVDELKEQYSNFDELVQLMSFSKEQYKKHNTFIKVAKEYYKTVGDERKLYQWTIMENYFFWIYHRQFSNPETEYQVLYKNTFNINISYFNSIRDSIMADIFINDYSANKNVKAVIKTSAYHSLRNFIYNSPIENLYIGKKVHVFNDILNKKLTDSIYSICFVASSGKWGLNLLGNEDTKKIRAPKKSLENYFKKSDYPFFFSNFLDSFDINSNFIMKVVFQKAIKAKWAQIFSGVFFIKEMYPVKYLYPEKHMFKNVSPISVDMK